MKYLLLVLVVGVVLAVMSARRRSAVDRRTPRGAARPRRGGAPQAEPMLACAHCGVHLPREEAVQDAGGRAYCGPAHRLAGPR